MSHPFASSDTIYPTHSYAQPTMVGIFPMSHQSYSIAYNTPAPRLHIGDDSYSLSTTSSEKTLSPTTRRRYSIPRPSWSIPSIRVGKAHGRRILYVVIAATLIALWIVLIALFGRDAMINHSTPTSSDDGLTITLQGTMKTFDPSTRSLSINWTPLGNDNLPLGTSDSNKQELGIFTNVLSTPDTDHTALSGWTGGLSKVDNSSALPIAVVGQHPWDTFTTDINVNQLNNGKKVVDYPFDQWQGQVVLLANAQDWARRAGDVNSYVVQIAGASLTGSSLDWKITLSTTTLCSSSSGPCALQINITASRTILVQFTTLLLIILNWVATLFVLVFTCETIFIHRHSLFHDVFLLVVCFAALFALPSVRVILPGTSSSTFGGFGMVDFVGVIPNVIIVALCAMMLAVSSLRHYAKLHSSAVVSPDDADRSSDIKSPTMASV